MARPWYPRYPGDYARKTPHLRMVEHGAYSLLMDLYYQNGPIEASVGKILHSLRAFKRDERQAVEDILNQFFELRDGQFHNKRADEELERANDISEKRSAARKCRTIAPTIVEELKAHAGARQPQSHTKEANASLGRKNGTRWLETQSVPAEWIAEFLTGPHGVGWSTDALRREATKFENFWTAKTGAAATKLNWKRTFENWCLNAKGTPDARQSRNSNNPGALNRIARLHAEAREAESLGEV